MEKGSIVKFKDGLYDFEEGLFYIILELNGDRALIQYLDMRPYYISPSSLARTAELEEVAPPREFSEEEIRPYRKRAPGKKARK